ncbi:MULTISPECIES: DUF6681 family protein [Enterococcus]|uniref:Uncharacterized protein n=1 Tax=Enterococcus sulfureus ATCC 49903 TaxID=1140003 RepID=S0L2T3_9ENTE|nr:DUF6681 family protein [Enterococcus sulfureus]EOT46603.1 hypothetical protein OMY_01752 [Enterococcus sulfureus ATCC 49903]EOT86085.1 hypothetical protein I573_00838 [Enterococcus sulfureus ATCC 49903]
MSFLLDIINGINKFLGYLDISPKYLNRSYTILSIFPTLYILRIVYGLLQNENYLQFVLYSIVFIVLIYFIVLNIFYYFFDKNLKADVTQLFVKYLPDEVFNIQQEAKSNTKTMKAVDTKEIEVDFYDDYELILAMNMQELIDKKVISVNDLNQTEGYLIEWNTIYPYYFVKRIHQNQYELQIGTSYQSLVPIGRIEHKSAEKLEPVGLYVTGGDFVKDGFRYHEPYHLTLLAKSETPLESHTMTMSRTQRRKKT